MKTGKNVVYRYLLNKNISITVNKYKISIKCSSLFINFNFIFNCLICLPKM